MKCLITFLLLCLFLKTNAQEPVWNPNLADGNYKNPVIYADYSDPDAIRVGDDYFMVSSSFSHFPGLPILHSKDMINWQIIGHAAAAYPDPVFEKPQHGDAIWAPSIRYHAGIFYIFYGDPDRGVFMTQTKDPFKGWEPLKLIKKVTGWIDCCPLWDEDGKAYLVHAYANSRAGVKSILLINEMAADASEIYGTSTLVFNGQKNHETIEGPKLYKRNGFYYIFAPAGGVKPGWQTVLRSKNIYGPYEDKVVLEQGSTKINGPHQGAWVTTQTGEDWFFHFQDKYAYGRLVLLEPMTWEADWPNIGIDNDGNGIGEPVETYRKPDVGKGFNELLVPQTSDEFDTRNLGLQWQWQANPKASWFEINEGKLKLFPKANDTSNLWQAPHLLLQKLPAPNFSAVTKISLKKNKEGEKIGLVLFGMDYAYIAAERNAGQTTIQLVECVDARGGKKEMVLSSINKGADELFLKVQVKYTENEEHIPVASCQFSYSLDGRIFSDINGSSHTFKAKEGRWVGAKVGLFAVNPAHEAGYSEVDWFRVEP